MSKQFVPCQLPGCTRVIAVSLDEPTPRKYCCAEHRVAARRLRHEVLAGSTPATVTLPKPAPSRPRRTPLPGRPTLGDLARRSLELGRQGTRRGTTFDRRCAQRGLELGRQGARRGVELGQQARTRLVAGCRQCRDLIAHELTELRTGWRGATRQQRHAIVLIGFTVFVMATGGLITALALDAPSGSAPAVAAPAPVSLTAPPGMAAWAGQATTDLTAVQHQLTQVATAENAWTSLPATVRTGDLAASYALLERRKVLLRQEQTMLQTGLAAVDAVRRTSTTLHSVEGQLAGVRAMVSGMPPAGQRTITENSIYGQLLEQQNVLDHECAMLRQELAGWITAVRAALSVGLPDPADDTTVAVDTILAASRPSTPTPAAPPAPGAVFADGPPGRSRRDVTTSAPPRRHPSSSESSSSGIPGISIPGLGDLGGLEQLGFGIADNMGG